MGAPPAFPGFPPETFGFLRGLGRNNTREWFSTHREDYERCYAEPGKALVEALGPGLAKLTPAIRFEPRVNGSLFRINRDTRFSKDKTPYKDHMDLWFWEGERRGWDTPGFFFRLTGGRLILGAGMHRFDKDTLAAYRKAVLDDKAGKELAALAEALRKAGAYELGGRSRKAVPRGFDPAHARADFLLHEGLTATLDIPVPEEASTPAFTGYCLGHYKALAPVNRWLSRHVK